MEGQFIDYARNWAYLLGVRSTVQVTVMQKINENDKNNQNDV